VIVTVYENRSESDERAKRWKEKEEELNKGESVAESGRIFIRLENRRHLGMSKSKCRKNWKC
jgi:hypothetical protein